MTISLRAEGSVHEMYPIYLYIHMKLALPLLKDQGRLFISRQYVRNMEFNIVIQTGKLLLDFGVLGKLK